MKIKLIKGDITEIEVDAIVNAANNKGIMGGGVAAAIRRKGGIEIEKEAMEKAPWPIGDAIVTSAGRLKAKYIIHAATMGLDFKTDPIGIRNATKNAMKRGMELKVKSMAFPALGAGVGRIPIGKVAEIMLSEIQSFEDEPKAPQEVLVVLFSDKDLEKFAEVGRKLGIKEA